jgi:hypothetical protein
VVANLYALVADEDPRTRDQLVDIVLLLLTEGATVRLGIHRLFAFRDVVLCGCSVTTGGASDL